MNVITPAATAADMRTARQLFEEYARELAVDLAFQNFTRELETLPGAYAPPRGALLLARAADAALGCVALRPVREKVCEMKRLYVRPTGRRQGCARALVAQIIAHAARMGYRTMVLDTLDWMQPAIALYESFGFERTTPYYDNPIPGAVYFQMPLSPATSGIAEACRPHRLDRQKP